MAFFNESYTNQQLAILNEKKSTEEYHRRSFKKKYNFEPDKPGSDIGKITVDGKKYGADMRRYKNSIDDNGNVKKVPNETKSSLTDKNNTISVGKDFFKLKGSNKSERRDSILQHEVGHQKLHNINSASMSVDPKNKTNKVFNHIRRDIIGDGKKDDKFDSNKLVYDLTSTRNKDEIKKRDDSLETAKKYEIPGTHTSATEFEADRYAANKTSERALRKSLNQLGKIERKVKSDDINNTKISNDDKKKRKRSYENNASSDQAQRRKALKDNDLRKSDVYK